MKRLFLWLAMASTMMTLSAQQLLSPNGTIGVTAQDGQWVVSFQQRPVLQIKTAANAPSLAGLKPTPVQADYTMLSGKRRHCVNSANEYVVGSLRLRLYNDGLAFRYEGVADGATTYVIADGTKRWLMKWTDSYEGFFPRTTTAQDGRWGYPALLEPRDGVFALITEANIERGQSASCLYSEGNDYRVVADKKDGATGIAVSHTPWRVVIIGTLGDVVESTLVTDVSEPCRLEDASWVKPGVAAWVYWAYNHGSNDYNIIKRYTDMAAALKLPYVLIDAEWDQMLDGKTVEDAVSYAKSQGVRPMIWYNSSVGWIDGAPTPKFRLNKAEDREREFAWCEQIGVAGVKIDFFSGDTQRNMDYCIDLLESAARHHLLVNFHGATIPRGWQRTYPNLLSTEGVYGAEWYNNVPTFTDRAAAHNATLPFTRNVIGPMDYTPCAFTDSQHPHITTHAHELALTALYESGLQHLADRPESFLTQPQAVKDYLSELPTAWDETRFVSGYPGESCVLARRSGMTWYVAGINGTDSEQTLRVPLDFISQLQSATIFADSGNKEQPWRIDTVRTLPATVVCQPRGGFLFVIKL